MPIQSFSNVDELEEANRKAGWNLEYHQLGRGPFSAHFAARQWGEALLMRERFGASMEIVGEPPDGAVAVIVPVDVDCKAAVNGCEVRDGRLFVMRPGSELNAIVSDRLEAYSLYLPESALFEATGEFSPRYANLSGYIVPVSAEPSAINTLHRKISRLIRAPAPRGITQQELVSDITTHIVDLISNSDIAGSRSGAPHSCSSARSLGVAREYIEAHLFEPIRIPNVCRHAGISARTLERLFGRELSMSPTQYIRARRLNSIRRRLIASDPEACRVTDIAFDHGFTHLGRFAGEYRAFFGEPPSRTLNTEPRARQRSRSTNRSLSQ